VTCPIDFSIATAEFRTRRHPQLGLSPSGRGCLQEVSVIRIHMIEPLLLRRDEVESVQGPQEHRYRSRSSPMMSCTGVPPTGRSSAAAYFFKGVHRSKRLTAGASVTGVSVVHHRLRHLGVCCLRENDEQPLIGASTGVFFPRFDFSVGTGTGTAAANAWSDLSDDRQPCADPALLIRIHIGPLPAS
jgi:hypothetical protein